MNEADLALQVRQHWEGGAGRGDLAAGGGDGEGARGQGADVEARADQRVVEQALAGITAGLLPAAAQAGAQDRHQRQGEAQQQRALGAREPTVIHQPGA